MVDVPRRRIPGFWTLADGTTTESYPKTLGPTDPEPRWTRGYIEVYCCGEWLRCDRFTNTCPSCGDDYNSSGQLLAPREQWGEETGESVADILAVDFTSLEDLLDGKG